MPGPLSLWRVSRRFKGPCASELLLYHYAAVLMRGGDDLGRAELVLGGGLELKPDSKKLRRILRSAEARLKER